MSDPAGDSQIRRHSLADWLSLHELDAATCRRILDAIADLASAELTEARALDAPYDAPDAELAWLTAADAMRAFLPHQHEIIGDTSRTTLRIAVDQPRKSRKALTLDNGPTAFPTILYSYFDEPSDALIIMHEFGHALQIRASQGRPVPPIMREVCAFIAEAALLSHTRRCAPAHYPHLLRIWKRDNARYLKIQSGHLLADLSREETAYRYAWNYPIARYLAVSIAERDPIASVWTIFEGRVTVRDALRHLAFV